MLGRFDPLIERLPTGESNAVGFSVKRARWTWRSSSAGSGNISASCSSAAPAPSLYGAILLAKLVAFATMPGCAVLNRYRHTAALACREAHAEPPIIQTLLWEAAFERL